MRLFSARLLSLAFVGLAGAIIYNALYLQNMRDSAGRMMGGEGFAAASEADGDAQAGAPNVQPGGSTGSTTPVSQATATKASQPVQEASAALVTAVQRELAARGYNPGPDDGVLRPQTVAAIDAYQKRTGLPETGQPSDDLLRHIVLGESLDEIPTGSVVKTDTPPKLVQSVQQLLADLGYAPGAVDGVMGQNTRHAILAFQRDRKLAQTGQITPTLLKEMERVSGRKLPGAMLVQ